MYSSELPDDGMNYLAILSCSELFFYDESESSSVNCAMVKCFVHVELFYGVVFF
jgi:hypothetical protein